MMKEAVQVSLVQFAPTWLDRAANVAAMVAHVEAEAAAGGDLVVFPELADVGYFTPPHSFDPAFAARYHALAEPIPGPTTMALVDVAARTGAHVTVGLLERRGDDVHNSMVLCGPSGVVGTYRKVHLPRVEKHYFSPGHELPVFDTPLGRIGLSICYDGRFPELTRTLALRGAEIVCSGWAAMRVPATDADDAALGLIDQNLWHRAYTRAQENGVFYLACDRAGVEGTTVMLGRSAIAGPNGDLLAVSNVEGEDVVRATLRASLLREVRAFIPVLADRRPDLYGALVESSAEPG